MHIVNESMKYSHVMVLFNVKCDEKPTIKSQAWLLDYLYKMVAFISKVQ